MSQASENQMHWASAVSERVDTRTALREAARSILAERPEPPDLVFVFASPHHAPAYEQLSRWLREELGDAQLAGCAAPGVIGGGCELEGREALGLTAAWLPGVRVRVHYFPPALELEPPDWFELIDVPRDERSHFVLFADPLSFDVDALLRALDEKFPQATKLGGLASTIDDEPAAMFVEGTLQRGGALVVAFQGACELRAVVAQGCRPVGEPFIVTRARGNVIKELNAGRPADVLRRVYDGMNAHDHALFNTSLFLGIDFGAADNRSRYERGDFLIRNILGVDPDSGALAVDAHIEAYQVVQFHLRDRATAAEDLSMRLRELSRSDASSRIRGALLFSCLGRGERLFGAANHDSDSFAKRVGAVALGGFFSQGEIAPLGKRTCLQGHTSVFALFCTPAAPLASASPTEDDQDCVKSGA